MDKIIQMKEKRLSSKELRILHDAMETLTISILHDDYNYEIEDLSNLHKKILKQFHQRVLSTK